MTSTPAKKTPPAKTAKPAAKADKTPGPKAVARAEQAALKPAVVTSDDAAEGAAAAAILKLKDLVAHVADVTGAKKPQVKTIIEAALAEIGRVLDKGEGLNLPPFGRLKVNRSRELGDGTLLSMKLKRGATGKGGKNTADEGLADSGEDS